MIGLRLLSPLVGALLLTSLAVAQPSATNADYLAGQAAAKADLEYGGFTLKIHPSSTSPNRYQQVLKRDYKIATTTLTGVSAPHDWDYLRGYNDTERAAIRKRLGDGIWQTAAVTLCNDLFGQALKSIGVDRKPLDRDWPSKYPSLYEQSAYRAGQSQAVSEVAQGFLFVHSYGMELYKPSLAAVLDRDCHIRKIAHGCVVYPFLEHSVRGYNRISQSVIEKRYGKGVFEKAAAKAEAQEQAEQKKPKPSLPPA